MTDFQHSLIIDHMPLARKIAKGKSKKCRQISFDEIEAAAYFGLVDAASKFDSKKCDCFCCYASFRIIGAIRDYFRELSWGPRSRKFKVFDLELVDSFC